MVNVFVLEKSEGRTRVAPSRSTLCKGPPSPPGGTFEFFKKIPPPGDTPGPRTDGLRVSPRPTRWLLIGQTQTRSDGFDLSIGRQVPPVGLALTALVLGFSPFFFWENFFKNKIRV